MIELGTKPETKLKIETPVIHLSKTEIIKKGIELKAPLHLTWSCYQNEDIACGVWIVVHFDLEDIKKQELRIQFPMSIG